jgi:hypothetical protein
MDAAIRDVAPLNAYSADSNHQAPPLAPLALDAEEVLYKGVSLYGVGKQTDNDR